MFAMSYLEATHDERHDGVAFFLRHLVAGSNQHQHVVTVSDPHCIQVTQYVGTRYLALIQSMVSNISANTAPPAHTLVLISEVCKGLSSGLRGVTKFSI